VLVTSTDPASTLPASAPPDFDALFCARYQPMVRSITAAFGDREQAAEVVQEAFVRAYTRWRRVSSLDDPAGWIRRVAVNLALDQSRRRSRGRRALERLGARTPTTSLAADAHLPQDDVHAALATLPPQQRLAMSLFYLEDLSVNEVADAMRLSAGAVKYHLNQGRIAMRQRLEHTR
jgi:RNA polymerase sigma-70 factor (ECF subfamily)